MATQYDPIAKDESLNTTEATPRNIADVLAEELRGIASALTPEQLNSLSDVTISSPSDGQTLKYNSVTQKWENANDAGGHIIENPSGTDMTQRGNLQFADAHLTDDSVNDRTEVEIAKEVTEAAFDALDPQGTEYDGVYLMEAAGATPLTADMVGYGSGTVKGALDKTKPTNVSYTAHSDITIDAISCVKSAGMYFVNGYITANASISANTAIITFGEVVARYATSLMCDTSNLSVIPVAHAQNTDTLVALWPLTSGHKYRFDITL